MSSRDTKLAVIYEDGEALQLTDGDVVMLDSPAFERWLSQPENRSFRFIAGDAGSQSFTARKEAPKKGTGEYWHAYRKVSGKLHKRYIGKSGDINLERLKEVAIALDTPATPRGDNTHEKASAQPLVTQSEYVTTLEDKAALQAEIEQLQSKLHNVEMERDAALGKSMA